MTIGFFIHTDLTVAFSILKHVCSLVLLGIGAPIQIATHWHNLGFLIQGLPVGVTPRGVDSVTAEVIVTVSRQKTALTNHTGGP